MQYSTLQYLKFRLQTSNVLFRIAALLAASNDAKSYVTEKNSSTSDEDEVLM